MKHALAFAILFAASQAHAGPVEDLLTQPFSESLLEGLMWSEWNVGSRDCAVCVWWALHYAVAGDWAHALDFGELAYYLASSNLNRAIIAVAYWEWFGREQERLRVPDLGLNITE